MELDAFIFGHPSYIIQGTQIDQITMISILTQSDQDLHCFLIACSTKLFKITLLKMKMSLESKKGDKDQESIQSRTTPDPGYHMGK